MRRSLNEAPPPQIRRGSTSGVQEDTLGLLGSARGSKGQQDTRGESQGSLQSQRGGVYSRAFIFLQPLCSQGDRPNSGKLKDIQPGHWRFHQSTSCPCVGLAPSTSPSTNLSSRNTNPKALTAFLTAWLSKPPKPSKPQTLTQQWDAISHERAAGCSSGLNCSREVPESSSSDTELC